jgi:GT2 family glycosyltransferase
MLSVIVPTCNDDHRLEMTMRGLMGQEGSSFEIVVVNDGGTSSTKELLQSLVEETEVSPFLAGVQYHYLLPPSDHFRAAAARNVGIRHAQGSRLVLCDCDTVPAPGYIAHHAKMPLGILIGLRRRVSCEAVETCQPSEVTLEWLDRNVHEEDERTTWPALVRAYQALPHGHPHSVFWSCNLSMPIHQVRSIGGFDETFVGWGGEDEDLGIRLMRIGLKCYRCEALVYHLDHPPRTSAKASAHLQRTMHQPVLRNGGPIVPLEPSYL